MTVGTTLSRLGTKVTNCPSVLDRIGPENTRARLAQTDAGSRGAITVGTEPVVTIGFILEWLVWHDKRKAERESTFRANQIFLDALGRKIRKLRSGRSSNRRRRRSTPTSRGSSTAITPTKNRARRARRAMSRAPAARIRS
jgi:hypothetical protein